jgi:hypothetical protein
MEGNQWLRNNWNRSCRRNGLGLGLKFRCPSLWEKRYLESVDDREGAGTTEGIGLGAMVTFPVASSEGTGKGVSGKTSDGVGSEEKDI